MSGVFYGFAFSLATALFVLAGDFVLKLAADGGKPVWSGFVLVGAGVYALSALLWFFAMRHVSLAQAGVAYSMLTLLALCALGVIYFDEKLELREVMGIGFALAAMVLMVRVT